MPEDTIEEVAAASAVASAEHVAQAANIETAAAEISAANVLRDAEARVAELSEAVEEAAEGNEEELSWLRNELTSLKTSLGGMEMLQRVLLAKLEALEPRLTPPPPPPPPEQTNQPETLTPARESENTRSAERQDPADRKHRWI